MIDSASTKNCASCKQDLPRRLFSIVSRKQPTLRGQCNKCRSEVDKPLAKIRRDSRPDYGRRAALKLKYGIDEPEFDELLRSQGGSCALCKGTSAGGRFNRFHVDHCHKTGRIRGLLCHKCNVALGILGDTPESLKRAYDYVAGERSA